MKSEIQEALSTTALAMLEASATIQNIIRHIERDCPYGDDRVIKEAIAKLGTVSGDLAGQWEDTDTSLLMLQN